MFDFLNPLKDNDLLNDSNKELLSLNLVGAKNLDELMKIERLNTYSKSIQLSISPINGNFDYQHLKDIHKF